MYLYSDPFFFHGLSRCPMLSCFIYVDSSGLRPESCYLEVELDKLSGRDLFFNMSIIP